MAAGADCVLASATDDNFAPAAAVALLSAATRRARPPVCVVIDCGMTENTRSALRLTFAEQSVPLVFRTIEMTPFAALPLSAHFTAATYARLATASLTKDIAQRTLYLDADTLTMTSVDELARAELHGFPAAAVQDLSLGFVSLPGGVAGWRRLGLKPAIAQFNAGVLLIDNQAWEAGGFSESAIELLMKHPEEATFADQGALNAVLAGDWIPLENRWNVQVRRSFAIQAFGRVISRHSLVKTTELGILHFVGILKPWEPDYAPSAYRRIYAEEYRQFAPFAPELHYWNPIRWARIRR